MGTCTCFRVAVGLGMGHTPARAHPCVVCSRCMVTQRAGRLPCQAIVCWASCARKSSPPALADGSAQPPSTGAAAQLGSSSGGTRDDAGVRAAARAGVRAGGGCPCPCGGNGERCIGVWGAGGAYVAVEDMVGIGGIGGCCAGERPPTPRRPSRCLDAAFGGPAGEANMPGDEANEAAPGEGGGGPAGGRGRDGIVGMGVVGGGGACIAAICGGHDDDIGGMGGAAAAADPTPSMLSRWRDASF